jgi:HlyD family secretion protein
MLGAVGGWLRGAGALVAVAGAAAGASWWFLKPRELPSAFASGNGRVEAVEVDIAAKIAGRIKEVLVNEGEFVHAGQTVAEMDSSVLDAQLREAHANFTAPKFRSKRRRAWSSSEKRKKDRLKRSLRNGGPKSTRRNGASPDPERFPKGAAPESKLDDDRTAFEAAKSAVAAAEMQAAAQAAIGQAPSRWLARMRPSRPPRRRSKPISTTAS